MLSGVNAADDGSNDLFSLKAEFSMSLFELLLLYLARFETDSLISELTASDEFLLKGLSVVLRVEIVCCGDELSDDEDDDDREPGSVG